MPKTIEILGRKSLPKPVTTTIAELQTGRFDSLRVCVRGVVRNAEDRGELLGMRLHLGGVGGVFVADIKNIGDMKTNRLVDSEVELTGVVFSYFNLRSELLGFSLVAADTSEIVVLHEGLEDPFSAPVISLQRMRRFSLEGLTLNRQRLLGQVSYFRPGK